MSREAEKGEVVRYDVALFEGTYPLGWWLARLLRQRSKIYTDFGTLLVSRVLMVTRDNDLLVGCLSPSGGSSLTEIQRERMALWGC